MTLEYLLPQCPIHKEIENKNLKATDIIVFGYQSNDCVKCPDHDETCHLYKAWYHDYQIKHKDLGAKNDSRT